jgi:hypothetical protein
MCDCKNSAECSHINGTCFCAVGFQGEKCEEICHPGYYGQDCAQKCKCKNGAMCSPETGQCLDPYDGTYPSDRYGANCSEICRCENDGKCDHVSGECKC